MKSVTQLRTWWTDLYQRKTYHNIWSKEFTVYSRTPVTVEPSYNKLFHNKFLDIANNTVQPCAIVIHKNMSSCNNFLLITNSLPWKYWFVIRGFHCTIQHQLQSDVLYNDTFWDTSINIEYTMLTSITLWFNLLCSQRKSVSAVLILCVMYV